MRDFRTKYRIKNVHCLEDFEKNVGSFFQNVKDSRKLSDINFKLVNELDKKLYSKVLKLKSDYNKYAPL